MANRLEHIEKYFNGTLSDEEKSAFEKKCEADPSFAKEVGFYISVRLNVRENLYTEKKRKFDDMYVQLSSDGAKSIGSSNFHSVLSNLRPYFKLAAACLLLILGWIVVFKESTPKQLASDYIENNLQNLSVTMNGDKDSLQLGIDAFNRQKYSSAKNIFRSLANQANLTPEAIKNLGIIYLVTDEYDKAIIQFDSLSSFNNLHANPGPFYKAVTLMKRSRGNDQKEARKILEVIKEQQLPGSKEAERWIEHF